MSAPPPRQYITEPGALDDIPVGLVLQRHARPASPTAAPATGTEARVCQDIGLRQALGRAKYGTTVEANPLTHRQWLQHAYEEALDLAIYLKRAIEQMDRDQAPNPPPAP
jgi:hypothetical protein